MDREELRDPEYIDQDQEQDQDERFYEEGDEEGFYEAEEDDEAEAERNKEVDDLQFFLTLMKGLRMTINQGSSIPFTSKKIVDAAACLEILDSMEGNLPQAVEYGMKVYDEYDRMMNEAETKAINCVSSAEMKANTAVDKAKKQADDILKNAEKEARAMIADAQKQSDMMVSESEIVKRAQEEAHRIKNDAAVEARELRLKVRHEAIRQLGKSQRELIESSKNIERLRKEIDASGEDDEY